MVRVRPTGARRRSVLVVGIALRALVPPAGAAAGTSPPYLDAGRPVDQRTNIAEIGAPAHRAVARRTTAESQVLLKNANHALPLKTTGRVYVAGSNADNIGNQAGGWTVTWQGRSGRTIPGTTILRGIRQVARAATVTYSADASAPMAGNDVGIAVVGETPYAEGVGDVGNNGHIPFGFGLTTASPRVG
jgi:beta-glucosidase-like glycosyl hydrolase